MKTHAVCHCDCPSPCWPVPFRSRTPSNVQPGSFALAVPVPTGPSCRTTRGGGCRKRTECVSDRPSSCHDRHGCARQHRDQSGAVRLCFRKWRAGLR